MEEMISKKLIASEETEDQFLDYHFFSEEELEEDCPHWIELDDTSNSWAGSNTPMPIDDAIAILQEMKSKGSNYIEIDYHCDHVSYIFSGWEIHKATEEEVRKERERLDGKNKELKEKKIQELKNQIKELEDEV